METSLPTPMTARVQLLIYQRVALLLLKHSFCCTIFPIFDDSMWMVVSLRHTYPTYALARWEEQWYPTVEQHTAIPLQHIYTRRSLVWRHCHINPCTSIIKSETNHFSQSFKHHFSSNPQFSWWIPSWWTASISYWCGLYHKSNLPFPFRFPTAAGSHWVWEQKPVAPGTWLWQLWAAWLDSTGFQHSFLKHIVGIWVASGFGLGVFLWESFLGQGFSDTKCAVARMIRGIDRDGRIESRVKHAEIRQSPRAATGMETQRFLDMNLKSLSWSLNNYEHRHS